MRLTVTSPDAPPSSPEPALPEPAPELVAHFTSPALRERLVGNVRWHGTPERRAEDVVQVTLTDAWARRHSWPETVDELERLLFTMLRGDRVDDHRKDGRAPLLRKDRGAQSSSDDAPGEDDDEGCDPEPVTVQTDPHETRDGLRFAAEYADSRPRLRLSLKWLFQKAMGASIETIAEQHGTNPKVVTNALFRLREELRKAYGPLALVLGFLAVAIALYVMRGRVDDSAKDHLPQPAPTVTTPPAPAPAPEAPTPPTADELRTRAFDECKANDWLKCLDDLDAARSLDPAGDASPRVQAARKAAYRSMKP